MRYLKLFEAFGDKKDFSELNTEQVENCLIDLEDDRILKIRDRSDGLSKISRNVNMCVNLFNNNVFQKNISNEIIIELDFHDRKHLDNYNITDYVRNILKYPLGKYIYDRYNVNIFIYSHSTRHFEVSYMCRVFLHIQPVKEVGNVVESITNIGSTLIIVDVQQSFNKFFSEKYLSEVNKYCKQFSKVYQIFDNHVHGKNPDKDYLYDSDPDIENKSGLYKFNNQVDLIEKRYTYDVDADFFKKILDNKTYNTIKKKESENTLVKGEMFNTTEGTVIVYIGNNHVWYHCPKKLYDLFLGLKGKQVTIVGGSDEECLHDVVVCGKALGVNLIENQDYIYSATHCPF
jgi:hypothetical protein